jgi:exosome complex component MTR3
LVKLIEHTEGVGLLLPPDQHSPETYQPLSLNVIPSLIPIFFLRGRVGFQSADDKSLTSSLQRVLQSAVLASAFPKSQVDVFATVLESGGSDLAAVISCAALALADAGVQLQDLVACCSVARAGPRLLVDPTRGEERAQDGGLLLALLPTSGRVLQAGFTGQWGPEDMEKAMSLGLDGCIRVDAAMRQALRAGL